MANTYKIILRFLHKAVVWYKKGRIAHAIHSVIRPWELQFEEDMMAIHEEAQRVEADANAASRAELRDAHLQIQRLQSQMNDLTSMPTQSK